MHSKDSVVGGVNAVAVVAIVAAIVVLLSAASQADERVVVVDDVAQFTRTASSSPPHEARWQTVSLPHEWVNDELSPRSGWYRFPLPDMAYETPHAVYLWRFAMNASVWVNDQYLGDGGSMSAPIARNWNYPLLFLLPSSAWREGPNYLYVQLATYPGWGNLPGVIIGPRAPLVAEYQSRLLWQHSGARVNFFIGLISALVGLTLWLARRSATEYFYFFCTCVAGAVFCANLFLRSVPLDPLVWSWIVHSALDWYCVGIALFGHKLLGVSSRWRTLALLGFGSCATIIYGFFDFYQFLHSTVYVHAVSILISVYLAALAFWSMWRRRNLEAMALFLCLIIMLVFSMHDLGLDTQQGLNQWRDNVYLLNHAFPILMLTMIVVLTRQFARAYFEETQAELKVADERERLYSDIHDDIGSRLLSLVYAAKTQEQAALARQSLQDVRTIIAGATHVYSDLESLLEATEAEARQRCESAGVGLTWHQNLGGERIVPHTYQYHLQRILRELVTNALKHSDTADISVQADVLGSDLVVTVRDEGEEVVSPSIDSGAGVASIRRRINEMSGSIDWQFEQFGCSVRFRLPIDDLSL